MIVEYSNKIIETGRDVHVFQEDHDKNRSDLIFDA